MNVVGIIFGGAAMLFAVVAFVLPLAAWSAYVMSMLWGWFLVPLGVPAIGFVQAWGIMLMISVTRGLRAAEPEDNKALQRLGAWLLGTVLALGIGYVLKGYL